jgi:hypothetical protein
MTSCIFGDDITAFQAEYRYGYSRLRTMSEVVILNAFSVMIVQKNSSIGFIFETYHKMKNCVFSVQA